jgi:hypothetical protein
MTPGTHMPETETEMISREAEIAETRASLERKIEELERRLSPEHIKAQVRGKLNPEPYYGLIAASAVAVGGAMVARGLRRRRRAERNARDAREYGGRRIR